MNGRPSILGLAATLLSGGVAALYLWLIAQGAVSVQGAEVYVGVVAAVLIGQSVACGLGTIRVSARLLASAGTMMMFTGGLALFSIGVPLMLAGLLAIGAAFRARGSN
jgi:hypothetical protein